MRRKDGGLPPEKGENKSCKVLEPGEKDEDLEERSGGEDGDGN